MVRNFHSLQIRVREWRNTSLYASPQVCIEFSIQEILFIGSMHEFNWNQILADITTKCSYRFEYKTDLVYS